MDAEEKAMWQKILAHQIEGIMFHNEASLLYLLLGCKLKAHRHTVQFINDTAYHHLTLSTIVSKYNEIIQPVPGSVTRFKIFEPELTTRPTDSADRAEAKQTIHDKYVEWEESTLELYTEAMEIIPDFNLLKKLQRCVKKELAILKS